MITHLDYSCLSAARPVLAYIDPNTVHSVFTGIMPMLIAGLTAVLAVIVWPLIVVRARLGKWLRGGSKLRWVAFVMGILALLAGIAVICVLVLG